MGNLPSAVACFSCWANFSPMQASSSPHCFLSLSIISTTPPDHLSEASL